VTRSTALPSVAMPTRRERGRGQGCLRQFDTTTGDDVREALICPPHMRPLIMDDPQLAGRAQLVEILSFKAAGPAFDGFWMRFSNGVRGANTSRGPNMTDRPLPIRVDPCEGECLQSFWCSGVLVRNGRKPRLIY
jgi:hypothetical protein